MMGRLDQNQERLFYSFCLDEVVPDDHLVRQIADVLDLSWVHAELRPFYSRMGRPSIDPVLMIRMLIIGYVFAVRSERALCREVQVNLAYRWSVGLALRTRCQITPCSRVYATSGSASPIFFAMCSNVLSKLALRLALSMVGALRWTPA